MVRKMAPYLFLLPALILILFFFLIPLVETVIISFQKYVLYEPYDIRFIGISNYKKAFLEDPDFWISMKNSMIWTGGSLLFQFILGFGLALLLNEPFKGRGFYQSVIFLPWAVPGFLIGITWRWMYNARFGVINDILLKLGIIDKPIAFLSLPNKSLLAVIVANIWFGIPFFAIMILSGLQAISPQLYEAAEIDGAGTFSRFFYITLPLLRHVIVVAIILRMIWIFNFADLIYIMTQGGPMNTSQILTTYIFFRAYASMDFGYAAALSVIAVCILLAMSILLLKITRFESEV